MKYKTEYQDATGNREVKSTLFAKIFADKKELLSLYNALNGTNYTDEEDIEVTTIDGAVYMTMKNDVSFILDAIMNLYEHQSTYNPNMPLRGVLYFATLYSKYIKTRGLDIYGKTLQKIPVPQYIVFYNGTDEEPDEQILLLSEAYQKEMPGRYMHGCLECEARMLNINYGRNRELMEKCKRLGDYAIFVDKVRKYTPLYPGRLDLAITRAIDECIAEDVLKDILEESKAEVLEMVLFEYNEELHMKSVREEGRDMFLTMLIQKKREKGFSEEEIAEMLEITVDEVKKH